MRILTSKKTPSTQEMAEILKTEISDYSYKLFGLGEDKSIIVRKSTFVGVQISKRKNEISIDGSLPSMTTWVLSSLLFIDGFGYFFKYIYGPRWKRLEQEIGVFLEQKYN